MTVQLFGLFISCIYIGAYIHVHDQFICTQLLDLADMRGDMEDLLWAHLQAEIVPQIAKYQVQPDSHPACESFSAQQLGSLICHATDQKST